MARTFQTISPIDGSVYVEREYASALEIEKVMASTWAGQELWRKTSLEERTEICNKVIDYFVNNADEIGEEITRQMGRPIRYSAYEILW